VLVAIAKSSLAAPEDHFVTTWKTDNPGDSNDTSITIPMVGGPYDADWDNDGIFDETGLADSVTHDFGVAGTYTVRIGGSYDSVRFDDSGDKEKILFVDQWGTQSWSTMAHAFHGCKNLQFTATDTPDFSAVTDMSWMFAYADLADPDTSGWDTSAVTDMSYMFWWAVAADPDTSGWNTSAVSDMTYVFASANSANPDVSSWDTSAVTSLSGMFAFNGTATPNTSNWDTSAVTDMSSVFAYAIVANPDTSGWNTSAALSMRAMFTTAFAANPDVSSWDTSSVTDMAWMFADTKVADPDTSAWDTSAVTNMSNMFRSASAADPDTSGWNVTSLTDATDMFLDSTLSQPKYDSLLVNWSAQDLQSGVTFSAGYSTYCSDEAVAARENMITSATWVISDGGRQCTPSDALAYSRYYGGEGLEYTRAVDVDGAGNIYLIGSSGSAGLATAGAFSESAGDRTELKSYPTCQDCSDYDGNGGGQVERVRIEAPNNILVTKFSPDGTNVIWSTYFNLPDTFTRLGINSAAVSDSGEVVFGIDRAPPGLPLVNPAQTYDANQTNGYVAKLSADGSDLVFATYLNTGSASSGALRGLAVSSDGRVAVTGSVGTDSSLPELKSIPGQSCTLNAELFERTDGYVALFASNGQLVFSSCLGGEIRDGSSTEGLRGVTFGDDGHLYVVGYSAMTDFPVVDPIQSGKNIAGDREMTISRIDPASGALVFSTWFGTEEIGHPPLGRFDYDSFSAFSSLFPWDIEVDTDGNIIVTGTVAALHYPTVNAFQTNMAVPRFSAEFLDELFNWESVDDIFVTKLNPVDGVVFSTYLGGSRAEGAIPALTLDAANNVYVLGVTSSSDYPTRNAVQSYKLADVGLVISKLTPAGALAFSSYLGGESNVGSNAPGGVAVNDSGQIVVGSSTDSADFPLVGSGTALSGRRDITLSIIDQSGFSDGDGDGVPDTSDAFPADSTEWRDIDGDLIGDLADDDDDGDGEPDATDLFPQDASETQDVDGDGAGDNRDEFDADLANYFDLDEDGIADFDSAETDRDGDGTEDSGDAFDFDATETSDMDGDRIGDNSDEDRDGDLILDAQDRDRLDFDIPVYSFERYDPSNTNIFKSPWPCGFSEVEGADQFWTRATDQAFSGSVSLGSRIIDDGQSAAIRYVGDFDAGSVEFWYKVSSQTNADVLTFSLDSSVELTASGETGWTKFTLPIEQGNHILEWKYAKDGTITEGIDAAWIDDLTIVGDMIFVDRFENRVYCNHR
jgi:hypothetical protein